MLKIRRVTDIQSSAWASVPSGCQVFLQLQPRGHYQTDEAASRNDWDSCPRSQRFTWLRTGQSVLSRLVVKDSVWPGDARGGCPLITGIGFLASGVTIRAWAVSLKSIPQPMTWQTEISVQISQQVWDTEFEIARGLRDVQNGIFSELISLNEALYS